MHIHMHICICTCMYMHRRRLARAHAHAESGGDVGSWRRERQRGRSHCSKAGFGAIAHAPRTLGLTAPAHQPSRLRHRCTRAARVRAGGSAGRLAAQAAAHTLGGTLRVRAACGFCMTFLWHAACPAPALASDPATATARRGGVDAASAALTLGDGEPRRPVGSRRVDDELLGLVVRQLVDSASAPRCSDPASDCAQI